MKKRLLLKKIKIIILLFVINSFLIANPTADSLLSVGLNFSYGFQLEKASHSLNQFILKSPNDPRGYHHLSNLHLWKFLGSKNSAEYERFIELSDKALLLAENKLDENDEDIEVNYLLGQIKSLRAVAFSTSGKTLDAFWASKSSIGYFEDVLDLDQHYYDAYLGLGMFSYALSFVPGVFNWALVLTGISGDKEEGLEYLELAYQKGNSAKTEAAFHLGKIYTEYIADYQKAESCLLPLTNEYPNNIMFLYQYSILKIRQRNLDEAREVLDKIIEMNIPSFQQITAFCYFLRGDIHFKLNEFDKALENYNQFIMNATQVDYTGIANYRMAICSGMLNDNLSFQRYLLLAKSGNLDLPEDEYANEKASELFDSGLTEEFKVILMARNLIDAGMYESAKSFLLDNEDSIKDNELKGVHALSLSEVYLKLGKIDRAIELAKKSFYQDYDKESWVKPFASYNLANSFLEKNNPSKAEKYLGLAESNNDFEYKAILESKINYLKRKLNLN